MLQPFTVVSFNCKHEIIPNFSRIHAFPTRKDRMISYIESIAPLCIGMQEFTKKLYGPFAASLPQYQIIGENRYGNVHPLNEQTAVLVDTSQASIQHSETIWLSHTPTTNSRLLASLMPRTCTMVEIELSQTKETIRVFNVHLDVGLSSVRYQQAKILLAYIAEIQEDAPHPFVILGDFNDKYDSKTITMLRHNLHPHPFALVDMVSVLLPSQIHNTFHGFKGNIKATTPIDYIFVSSDIAILQAAIITHPHSLSDHYPVEAKLQIKTSSR